MKELPLRTQHVLSTCLQNTCLLDSEQNLVKTRILCHRCNLVLVLMDDSIWLKMVDGAAAAGVVDDM